MVKTQIINKIDVATRQLREAIHLFFEQRDVIVIHTIVASAHQILVDLAVRAGASSVVKNTSALKEKEVQKFLETVNYPYNFFKHADHDPDKSINIEPLDRLTADFILDAIIMLQQLVDDIPIEAKIYWAWFVSYYHREFDNLPEDGEIAKMQKFKLGKMPFPEIVSFIEFADITGSVKKQE